MKGILDRFEGDKAVILIEEQKAEFIVGKSKLPTGSKVNTVFLMEENDGDYKILRINTEETQASAETSSNLMAKLRAKSSGSKFGKK
ncbi:DUF3006 domain-containing protein [Oceanobacillus longus]|uniref:DUF3006 domain-containing protein n=1 Tax=Oceanobacillus longus TaxID=930120 RepID=A0ABV8GY88_9BACI